MRIAGYNIRAGRFSSTFNAMSYHVLVPRALVIGYVRVGRVWLSWERV